MVEIKSPSVSQNKFPEHVFKIARTLSSKYKDFDHYNLKDPLDELVFIMCSTKTTEASYLVSFQSLKATFPSNLDLYYAKERDIAKAIASGGLSNQKAHAIKQLLGVIVDRFNSPTLEPLRGMSDDEVELFLTSLPNVGKKVARCVMMYSLNRQVFPVDTHCWRIARRLGWVRRTTKDGHCSSRDMDRLQSKIPPEQRFGLHVNLISHGRAICTDRKPKCKSCPIAKWCRRVGLPKRDPPVKNR